VLAEAVRLSKGWTARPDGKRPKSLVAFVRDNGGLRKDLPQASDLLSQDIGRQPGLLRTKEGGGRGFDEMAEKARDAGAMAYLVKPFSISDLVPAIEVALSRFTEIAQLEREVADLGERLETRKLIERAKGQLQAAHGMTEPEAFTWMQRAAMDRRTTMKRVAEVVLETLKPPDASPSPQ
jgi:hypothetical protein